MCDGGATRKIIAYTFKIQRTFTAHHENNIVAPRGELTTPEPVRACPRRRAERGVKAVARQARNPSWHHLSAALNTRWFIHEDSLTAITLIRLINGCCRGEMGRHTHTYTPRKRERTRETKKERKEERERELQRYSNGRYISEAYAATVRYLSLFAFLPLRPKRWCSKVYIPYTKKKGRIEHRQKKITFFFLFFITFYHAFSS